MSSEVTFLTKPALQRRWGKPDRTIDRWWKETRRLPPPDTYLGSHPAWREQTILSAEAEWARQGAARVPHQDTDKAHAAAAEKRAQRAEQSAAWVKKNAPKDVLKPARKPMRSKLEDGRKIKL
jgi:hypothetical protein